MMAEKAAVFGDVAIAEAVLTAPKPGAAKALGRKARGFDDPVWQAHRFSVRAASASVPTPVGRQKARLGTYSG